MLGNSRVVVIPKKEYASWLHAVEFKAEWLSKEELKELVNSDILDNRKVFILIPIFEYDKVKENEKGGST